MGETRVDFAVTGDSFKTSKPSSCSSGSLPIMHLPYTYPDYCGDYQVCIQGKVVMKKCPEGEEFAFTSPDATVICTPPSNATYCGKKREEKNGNCSSAPTTPSSAVKLRKRERKKGPKKTIKNLFSWTIIIEDVAIGQIGNQIF